MRRLFFEDVHELSNKMIHDVLRGSECVSAVCHYELATALLSELIQSDIPIGQIDISDYEWSGYDREYMVTIMDGNVYCNQAYGRKVDGYSKDEYIESSSDIVYVHQDCNSKILKYIDCDEIYEFSIYDVDDFDDFECDCFKCRHENCSCDGFCSDVDDDNDDEDGTVSYHSDSSTVSKDRYGKPTGFTKSWSITDEDGVYQSTTYSYYCSDEDMLRKAAKNFDVEL